MFIPWVLFVRVVSKDGVRKVGYLKASLDRFPVLFSWEAFVDGVVGQDDDLCRSNLLQMASFVFGGEGISIGPYLNEVSEILAMFWIHFFKSYNFFVVVVVPPLVESLSIMVWIQLPQTPALSSARWTDPPLILQSPRQNSRSSLS